MILLMISVLTSIPLYADYYAKCYRKLLDPVDQAILQSDLNTIDHFTVVCLVAWPLNESEVGVDLVLIETSLLFICK